MKHAEFQIGIEFETRTGRWRCTDVGSRTIIAIKISEVSVTTVQDDGSQSTRTDGAPDALWFDGPPYAVAKHVFDEDSFEDCQKVRS